MIKKRYFTISTNHNNYGFNQVIFRFENLDGAIEMFKYLMQGKAVELKEIEVPDNKQKPDKDGWVGNETLYIESNKEPDFHLGSETVEIYTQEEADKIKKERQEWKDSFKKEKK